MPRYVVDRTLPDTLQITQDDVGMSSSPASSMGTPQGVALVSSFVSADREKTLCISKVRRPSDAAPPSTTACRSTPSPR